VRRRQSEKFADRDQQIAANRGEGWAEGAQGAPASPPQDDSMSQLKQLAELRDQGIVTEEEFAAKKAQILGI
jgi:hypothetical protein